MPLLRANLLRPRPKTTYSRSLRQGDNIMAPNSNDHVLDDIDYGLLTALQENCNQTSVSLSKELKRLGMSLSAAACGRRIDALIKGGFIQKHCAILDPEKFGQNQLCFMLVRMHSQDQDSINEFLSSASKENTVLEIWEMTGLCDYLMKTRVTNLAEALRLSQRLAGRVADIQTFGAGAFRKETTAIRLRSAR